MKISRTGKTTKIIKIAKIALIAAALLLGAYFIPEYRPAAPQSPATAAQKAQAAAQAAQQAALAEIAAVSAQPQAPLALLTEPDDGVGAVRAAIATASTSLDLVIYELEDPALEQALADADARGVAVRVILQNVAVFKLHPNQAAFDFLRAHGVPVAWASAGFALTHQKTLIVDASGGDGDGAAATPPGAFALIMTFNLERQYYASSRDFALADRDPQDVAAIAAAFNADWAAAATGGGAEVKAGAAPARDLVWSPGAAPTLLALINGTGNAPGASATLDIYNEEMADPRIIAALEAAAARGVRVRVVMTYATDWKPAFAALKAAGVAVRTFSSSGKFYVHAKAIIANSAALGARAFVGSENFSIPSLDANRELGIIIARPDILASLENTFNKDWLAARPF